jgi:hypothetical protein
MLKIYFNSGKFNLTMVFLQRAFSSPFILFENLAGFWQRAGYGDAPYGKRQEYEALYAFSRIYFTGETNDNIIKDLMRFDLIANENEKSQPDWLAEPLLEEVKRRLVSLRKEVTTPTRIEYFTTDILAWMKNTHEPPVQRDCFLRFDYPDRGKQNLFTLGQRISECKL